mgnify:CR=1 FL=1
MRDRGCVVFLSYFMILLENTTMLSKAHVKSGGDIRVNGGTIYGKTSNVSKRKTNGMLHVRWKIDGI